MRPINGAYYLTLLLLVIVLFQRYVGAMYVSCPSTKQLNSLIDKMSKESGLDCDCAPNPSPSQIGWEITCIKKMSEKQSLPSNEAHSSGTDYYTLEAQPLGYTVTYVQGKSIEIRCDESAPDFKPAMFQGMILFCSLSCSLCFFQNHQSL